MTPTAAQATDLVGMKGMQVGILGTAETAGASAAGCIEIVIVALEA